VVSTQIQQGTREMFFFFFFFFGFNGFIDLILQEGDRLS
jgi:hypothetical protein